MAKIVDSENCKCQSCGNNMVFSPSKQCLLCDSCGSVKQINKQKTFQKHDVKENVQANADYKLWIDSNKIFKCDNCGSNVILNKLDISTLCPYCSSPLVCDEKLLPGLKPDAVIPFMFDQSEAGRKFVESIKKKWFLPNKFKKTPPKGDIAGIYIPSFSFDCSSTTRYSGELGKTETTKVNDQYISKDVLFSISGVKSFSHNDVIVESSSHISQPRFACIKPYNLSELFDFDESYIRGYHVECYDNIMENCEEIAQDIIKEDIKSTILRQYDYDFIQSFSMSTEFTENKYGYFLLPSYEFKYLYQNKKYTTFMNGQTGKVGGGVPRSKIKIGLFVFGITLIIAACAVLGYILS